LEFDSDLVQWTKKLVLIRFYYTLGRVSRQIPCISSHFLHTSLLQLPHCPKKQKQVIFSFMCMFCRSLFVLFLLAIVDPVIISFSHFTWLRYQKSFIRSMTYNTDVYFDPLLVLKTTQLQDKTEFKLSRINTIHVHCRQL
jgi:hypothetical protein